MWNDDKKKLHEHGRSSSKSSPRGSSSSGDHKHKPVVTKRNMVGSSAKVHHSGVQRDGDGYRQLDADAGAGGACGTIGAAAGGWTTEGGPPVCARTCATCREDGPCCRDPRAEPGHNKRITEGERAGLWGEKDGMRLGDTVGINQTNYLDKTCFKVALRELYEVETSAYDN